MTPSPPSQSPQSLIAKLEELPGAPVSLVAMAYNSGVRDAISILRAHLSSPEVVEQMAIGLSGYTQEGWAHIEESHADYWKAKANAALSCPALLGDSPANNGDGR